MIIETPIKEWLEKAGQMPVLDARSPAEYHHAHFPGSISFPLLNNEEREAIGICYKRKGNKAAVLLGYELVGPKFSQYLKQAYELFPTSEVCVYCWRGGLRSRIIAQLLSNGGFKVHQLRGGYKVYRNAVLEFLKEPFPLIVIGGKTGCGKTKVLEHLFQENIPVLNLEKLAAHKGSAFGALGQPPQPGMEQFENDIYAELIRYESAEFILTENESRWIGSVKIPDQIYSTMRETLTIELLLSREQRVKNIIEDYAGFDKNTLAENTLKLSKRMGFDKAKQAVEALMAKDYTSWVGLLLDYYDKAYDYGNSLRETDKIISLDINHLSMEDIKTQILLILQNHRTKQQHD
jgi:tRNA 2-selenouridine synthase